MPWASFLLRCLGQLRPKALSLGTEPDIRVITKTHPPHRQTPANTQINTPQTVLSLSFFHYKILHLLPFSIKAHMIKDPALLFLGQTKTQQKMSLFSILWHRMKNPQIHKGVLAVKVSGCRAGLWLKGGRRGNYAEIHRHFDKLLAIFL